VRPADRIACNGASGPEFVEVMYGAAKCRAIFAAVDNRLSAREVLGVLADAEPRVLVADQQASALAADVGSLAFDCDVLVTGGSYVTWRGEHHDRAPAVAEVAVVGIPSAEWDESPVRLNLADREAPRVPATVTRHAVPGLTLA
jgi:acyl-CoA synthetase (AMP-forming)/AMP-acid ligase II